MPFYQVKYQVNTKNYNTDIEAPNIDAVKRVFEDLTVAHILEIKEYQYINKPDYFETRKNYLNYTIYFNYSNRPPIIVKLPKLKQGKKIEQVLDYLKGLYPTADRVNYKFTSTY